MSEVKDGVGDFLDARDPIERAVSPYSVSSLSGEGLGGHRGVDEDGARRISAARGAAAVSRRRRDSFPSDEIVGGFFFDFDARAGRRRSRTTSTPGGT